MNEQRLDEEQLAALADGTVEVAEIPRDGFPLPEGYVNPPAGNMLHRCLDPKGIYRRNWFSLKLHKSDGMPARQHFNCAGKPFKVLVGVWVDVPPKIMEVLNMSVVQHVREGYDLTDALGEAEMMQVVDETPRFSYSAIPSS